jgi:hypothetical protein
LPGGLDGVRWIVVRHPPIDHMGVEAAGKGGGEKDGDGKSAGVLGEKLA